MVHARATTDALLVCVGVLTKVVEFFGGFRKFGCAEVRADCTAS
ncbi:hypothetical protein BSU04_46765 [Caballeronia sordidicola]|uniref:Uncharacterized protein n=1 Tax=Caballeronia sordidicola TaxID=196367 RepID=A0A226WJY5_CABSO|nr:hypothetical protein BSU04_46765 [Caballeronia sordidicola]